MPYSVKGINIKINGDTTGLTKAINSVKAQTSGLNSTMNRLNRSMKLDPSIANSYKNLQLSQDMLSKKMSGMRKQYEVYGTAAKSLKNEHVALSDKLRVSKQRVAELESSIKKSGTATKEQKEQLAQAKGEVNKYSNELKRNEQQQTATAAEMQILSNNLRALSKDFISTNSAVLKQYSALKQTELGLAKFASATKGISLVSALGIAGAVKSAASFETAWTGVLKTVEGTPSQLNQVKQGLKDLSLQTASSFEDIAKFAELGGQMGIATDSITGFTKTITQLNDTTNLVGEEGAQMMAKFANVMRDKSQQSNEYFERMGSTIVDLGNNFATTEQDLVRMSTRIAPSARAIGMTEQQVLALSTALSAVGIRAEAGGGAMSKWLSNINTMVVTGSEDLGKFAQVAGMTADEFATAWRSDPMTAFQALIHGIGAAGPEASAVLDELGINETRAAQAFLALANNAGVFDNALETSNLAWAANTAMTAEAEKRYATLESQAKQTLNAIKQGAADIGTALTPALKGMLGGIENVVRGFSNASDGTKSFVANALLVGASLSPMSKLASKTAGGMASLISGLGTASTGLLNFAAQTEVANGGATLLSSAAMQGATALASMQAAVLPVTVGIAALAAGVLYATHKFDEYNQKVHESLMAEDEAYRMATKLAEGYEKVSGELASAKEASQGYVDSTRENEIRSRSLMKTIEELNGKEQLSSFQKQQLASAVAELNKMYPDLALAIDEETGKLSTNTEELKRNLQQQQENARMQAYIEAIANEEKALAKAEIEYENYGAQLEELKKSRDELANSFADGTNKFGDTSKLEQYNEKISELEKNQKSLKKSMDESKESIKSYEEGLATQKITDDMANTLNAMKEQAHAMGLEIPKSIEEGMANGKINYEQALGYTDAVASFQTLIDRANTTGTTISSELATSIVNGAPDVETSISYMNNLVAFDQAIANAGIDGSGISNELWMAIASGEVNVQSAIQNLNAVVQFDQAVQQAGMGGTEIATSLAQAVASGKMTLDEAMSQLNMSVETGLQNAANNGSLGSEHVRNSINNPLRQLNADTTTNWANFQKISASQVPKTQTFANNLSTAFNSFKSKIAGTPSYMGQISSGVGSRSGDGVGATGRNGTAIMNAFNNFRGVSAGIDFMRGVSIGIAQAASAGVGGARNAGISIGLAFRNALQSTLSSAVAASAQAASQIAANLASARRDNGKKRDLVDGDTASFITQYTDIVPNYAEFRNMEIPISSALPEVRLGESSFYQLSPRRQAMFNAAQQATSALGDGYAIPTVEMTYATKQMDMVSHQMYGEQVNPILSRMERLINQLENTNMTINLQPQSLDGRILTDVVQEQVKLRDMLSDFGKGKW